MSTQRAHTEARAALKGITGRWAFVNGGLGLGGTTTFMCNLGGEFVRRGIPVIVLSLEHDNAFAADFEALKVPVVLQDERRSIFEDRLQSTLKVLADFEPTVVVSCIGPSSYEPLRYVPKGVERVLLVQADHAIHYDAAHPYSPFADAVVGVSEQIRQRAATMPEFRGLPSYDLSYGVVMPAAFKPRRPEPGVPLRIVYLGRLERGQKRVHLFPTILEHLVKSGIPFVWNIVGGGPESGFLTATMNTGRPDQQVRLLGPVTNRQVPAILEATDVLLLASDAEGLPLSVLEAMAHGVVPVVTDLQSGIRELLDDSNGRRVPVDNIPAYAQAIVDLYRNPEITEKLSRNARLTIERGFSTSAMADRWLESFPPRPPVQWPSRWKIRPPLVMNRPFYFSAPLRPLRRLALRLRAGAR